MIFFARQSTSGIPETSPAYREADESRDAGGRRQPFVHFLVVLAAAQDDAADFFAAFPPRRCDDFLAVLATIEPLDLPESGSTPASCSSSMACTMSPGRSSRSYAFLSPFSAVQLFFLRRDQQFEHEPAVAFAVEVVGQPLQTCRLPCIERLVPLRVVAHQNLAKARL